MLTCMGNSASFWKTLTERLLRAQHWEQAPSGPPIYSVQRRTQCVLGVDPRTSRKFPGEGDHGVMPCRPEGDMGPGHFTLGSPTELVDAFSVTSFLL